MTWVATRCMKWRSWLVKSRSSIPLERLGQRFDRFDVEVVARLVEDQDVVLFEQQSGQDEPCPLAAAENTDRASRSCRH